MGFFVCLFVVDFVGLHFFLCVFCFVLFFLRSLFCTQRKGAIFVLSYSLMFSSSFFEQTFTVMSVIQLSGYVVSSDIV